MPTAPLVKRFWLPSILGLLFATAAVHPAYSQIVGSSAEADLIVRNGCVYSPHWKEPSSKLVVKQGAAALVTNKSERNRNGNVASTNELFKGEVVISRDGNASESKPLSVAGLEHVAKQKQSTELSKSAARSDAEKAKKGQDSTNPSVLYGHQGELFFRATTPDDKWMLTGGTDKTARIWDLSSEQESARFVLKGHTSEVSWVVMTKDQKRAATASYDGTARVWDLETQETIAVLPAGRTGSGPRIGEKGNSYARSLNCVAISPDGRWVITGDIGMTAILWDMNAEKPEHSAKILEISETQHYPYNRGRPWIEISSDGKWAAIGSGDKVAQLWNLQAEDPVASPIILKGHKRPMVNKVMFSPDSRWLVTAGWDNFALVWDLRAKNVGASPINLSHRDHLVLLRFSADSRRIFTGDLTTLNVWDLNAKLGGAKPLAFQVDGSYLTFVAISPNANWVRIENTDDKVWVWDIESSPPQARLVATPAIHTLNDTERQTLNDAAPKLTNVFATINNNGTMNWWEMQCRESFPSR